MQTADATVDGKGNVIGDKDADYRNKDGFILAGPEYLTLFNGETGEIMDTVNYDPPRGNVREWATLGVTELTVSLPAWHILTVKIRAL